MSDDVQLTHTYPRLIRLARWRGRIQAQWRHCYLLLFGMFWVLWHLSEMPIPTLEETRFMGGLHPGHVLVLIYVLKLMWIPPLLVAFIFVLSFRIRSLNTPEAIAISGLWSCASLFLLLILALTKITF
jgi:hypothetical protein